MCFRWAIALLATWPLAAHHDQAVLFDTSKPTTLKGVVTKVEWHNPHAFLHMDVKGVSWLVQIASPSTLKHEGVTRDSFLSGETAVEVYLAKDGAKLADGREGGTLTLASGKKVKLPIWSAAGKSIVLKK